MDNLHLVLHAMQFLMKQLSMSNRGREGWGMIGTVNNIVNLARSDWARLLQYRSNHQELHHKCRVCDEILVDPVRFLF